MTQEPIPAVTADTEVQCAACATIATDSSMIRKSHYGGFWLCVDSIACALRWH
jgi:hypothetical protein